jgi:hypothetical protein
MRHINTKESYSAIKKKEILPVTGKLMELESILSKVSQDSGKQMWHLFLILGR